MPVCSLPLQPTSAAALRGELSARASIRASRLGLRHELTTGRSPSVIFGADDKGNHGNFHPASYQAICADPGWARRLRKAHTASVRAAPRADWHWRELDCAASSDALLMNIFCHPETFTSGRVAALLGVRGDTKPLFGVKPRVPLTSGRADTTEIDLQIGSLLLEAKLTESGFQTCRPALLERYRDLEAVFAVDRLPRTRERTVAERWDEAEASRIEVRQGSPGDFVNYQLIRGALAAYATETNFCVLVDARRHDLLRAWQPVLSAVLHAELRCRLQLLTWQELAGALPRTLQTFLADKYGILAAPLGW